MKLFAIISAATVTLASFTSTANAETSSIATKEAPTWTKDPVIPEAYNLILTELKCWKSPLPWTAPNACPNLSPGVYLPDHDEKFQMMQANILRMFPQTHQNSIYAKKYTFYAGDPKCGQAQQNPYMLSHNGIEHGRYYAKSRTECKTPIKGHATCAADCKLFGASCLRMKAFRNGRNGYIRSEAICGQSDVEGCLRDGHCGIFFLPERNFFSIGMAKGSGMIINGWRTSVDANKRWALAMGAHFDRNARAKRSFVAGDNDASLLFQTVYYNPENAVKAGYVLYQGKRHKMSVKLGDANRGIYELDVGANLPKKCEPYYFHFELSDGSTIRLPEDPRYMYGTAGINGCAHNHYFDSGDAGVRVFKANAGPDLDGGEGCVGCDSIDYENLNDANSPSTSTSTSLSTSMSTSLSTSTSTSLSTSKSTSLSSSTSTSLSTSTSRSLSSSTSTNASPSVPTSKPESTDTNATRETLQSTTTSSVESTTVSASATPAPTTEIISGANVYLPSMAMTIAVWFLVMEMF